MSLLAMLLASLVTSLVLCCLLIPSVWATLTAADDGLDVYELGINRVASRNPFRETGPPVCMAKLIMLRHKMNQSATRKRRTVSLSYTRQTPRQTPRQVSRSYNFSSSRPRPAPWIHFGRRFGRQNY